MVTYRYATKLLINTPNNSNYTQIKKGKPRKKKVEAWSERILSYEVGSYIRRDFRQVRKSRSYCRIVAVHALCRLAERYYACSWWYDLRVCMLTRGFNASWRARCRTLITVTRLIMIKMFENATQVNGDQLVNPCSKTGRWTICRTKLETSGTKTLVVEVSWG